MRLNVTVHAIVVAAACAATPLGAHAQTALASAQSAQGIRGDAGSSVALQEVVVTATRRRESALNVPVSLTVLSAAALDSLGATSINDYAALVPGLQIEEDEPGFGTFVIRGISTGAQSTLPTVAVYMDDTPMTPESAAAGGVIFTPDPDVFDVQRIEVLKGPQGTLFGSSAEGGVIHYVMNQPNLERFDGKAEVGFEAIPGGGTGNVERVLVNIPLINDALAFRADGFRITYPGYIDNVFRNESDINSSESRGGRAALLWQPIEALSIRASTYYQDLIANDFAGESVQPLTLRPVAGDLNATTPLRQPLETESSISNLSVSYDFPWANLLSSTSYQKQSSYNQLDGSNNDGVLFGLILGSGNAAAGIERVDLKKTTEEIRLTSPSGGTIEWIAGFFYTHESADFPLTFNEYQANGAMDIAVFPNILTLREASVMREAAEYGDITYHFTPAFDVQAGVRYDRTSQDFGENDDTFFGVASPSVAEAATLSKITYLGVARYHFNRDTMVYGRVATGYRPGGPNDVIPGTPGIPPVYHSDNLTNYELGWKGAVDSGRFDYTLDAYRINWDNIQIFGVSNTGIEFYANGGKAHSQGIEFELGYRPMADLRIGVSGSFGEAKLDQGIPVQGVTAEAGNELPYAPKVSYAATVDYGRPISQSVQGFAGLTVSGVGARRAYFANQTVGVTLAPGLSFLSTTGDLPAYTTVDLRGGVTWNTVTLTLYARNVANARGAVAASATGTGVTNLNLAQGTGMVGPMLLTLIQPRTFGFTAEYDF
jgi:iron complex outermembrane recepter protein